MTTTKRPRRQPRLTQIEELDEYLAEEIAAPERLTRAAYEALDAAARAQYNDARMRYISGGLFIATDSVTIARGRLRRTMRINAGRNAGHGGLLVNGQSGAGKTTLLIDLMRQVRAEYAQPVEDPADQTVYPVLYVQVPAASSGKAFIRAMAEALTLVPGKTEDASTTRTNVIRKLDACEVQLICVDEFQNLTGRGHSREETYDMVKGLYNDIQATFVFAGIDIGGENFFAGARGQQIRSRFTQVDLNPYSWAALEDREYWEDIVKALERRLPLLAQPDGSVAALTAYLHDRTGGSLGSLTQLIGIAAQDAIASGAEGFDREDLEDIEIDARAQAHYEAVKNNGMRAERETAA